MMKKLYLISSFLIFPINASQGSDLEKLEQHIKQWEHNEEVLRQKDKKDIKETEERINKRLQEILGDSYDQLSAGNNANINEQNELPSLKREERPQGDQQVDWKQRLEKMIAENELQNAKAMKELQEALEKSLEEQKKSHERVLKSLKKKRENTQQSLNDISGDILKRLNKQSEQNKEFYEQQNKQLKAFEETLNKKFSGIKEKNKREAEERMEQLSKEEQEFNKSLEEEDKKWQKKLKEREKESEKQRKEFNDWLKKEEKEREKELKRMEKEREELFGSFSRVESQAIETGEKDEKGQKQNNTPLVFVMLLLTGLTGGVAVFIFKKMKTPKKHSNFGN